MVRALKWIGIAVGGLVALAILVALLLPALVNLERYRTLLAGRVGKALGREVTLGALTVNLWRGIGAEAMGVRVAQAPGFGGEPFLTADALRVHLQVLPLLRGQVKVSSLSLEQPRIQVLRGPDGRWSVEDLLHGAPPPAPARPGAEAPRPGKGATVGAVLISEVAIRDGEIQLADLDRPSGSAIRLTGVSLRARQETLSAPIEVESRAILASHGGGTISTTGRIGLGDPEGPALDLSIRLAGLDAAPWQATLQAGSGAVSLSGALAGAIKLAGPLGRIGFTGQLDLKGLGIKVGQRFEKAEGEAASVSLQGRREGPGLLLSSWQLGLKGMTLEGTVRIPDLARSRLVFTVSSPLLDVDRLLTRPKSATTWLLPASAWAALPPPAPAAGEPLSAEGTLSVGQLKYAGLTWSDVGADLHYQGGVLQASRVRAAFLGGTVQGQAEVDLRPKAPRVTLASRLEGIATAPLVRALRPGEFSLDSWLNLDSQVSFVGFALPDILGSANGQGSLHLGEGRLQNYPPLDRLAEVLAPILASQGVRVRLHEFKQLDGTYTIGNGILRTRDLTLLKEEGNIVVTGALGVLDRALDADIVARLGRTTVEAKVTGTADKPIVIPKLARLQRKLESEIDKLLPEEQGKGLKDLFKQFFRR